MEAAIIYAARDWLNNMCKRFFQAAHRPPSSDRQSSLVKRILFLIVSPRCYVRCRFFHWHARMLAGIEVPTSSGNYKLHAADQGMGLRSVELCGPADYTLRELVQFTADTMGIKRKIIGLPDWAARAGNINSKCGSALPGRSGSTQRSATLSHFGTALKSGCHRTTWGFRFSSFSCCCQLC